MKIFIIGKEGFVAQYLVEHKLQGFDLLQTSIEPDAADILFNLENAEQFPYEAIEENDYILHLAAISSPDFCKKSYAQAYRINVEGTKYFIDRCLKQGARVIFAASDVVYGDADHCFDEKSPCLPFGEYGKMKFEVEEFFASRTNFRTLRFSYIFSAKDKFTSYLRHCAQTGEVAEIFHPLSRNAIYIDDLGEVIFRLINDWDVVASRVVNICGEELVSRLDMARMYQEIVDSKFSYTVVEPAAEFYQARPKTIEMKSLFLKQILGRPPLSLAKAMEREFAGQND